MNSNSIGIIIVAGGSGRRMGGKLPKQFAFLAGRPILVRTIDRFAEALPGAKIVVVLPQDYIPYWKNLAARFEVAAHETVAGGAERFDSVRNGLQALPEETELIAVQDAVRPLGSAALIRRTVEAAAAHGAAVPVVEPVDSLRQTGSAGSHPIDRSRLRIVQTPQCFRADLLREAYAAEYRAEFTDDASVVEQAGHAIFLTEGERRNLKITTPDDLIVAEALLEALETPNEDGDQL